MLSRVKGGANRHVTEVCSVTWLFERGPATHGLRVGGWRDFGFDDGQVELFIVLELWFDGVCQEYRYQTGGTGPSCFSALWIFLREKEINLYDWSAKTQRRKEIKK